jgi:hypothetical protein
MRYDFNSKAIDDHIQNQFDNIMHEAIMKNVGTYWFADYWANSKLKSYKPKQIIFQPDLKTTVVIWEDDSKTVVKCSAEEQFVPEIGFAMALVKKIFPNRSEFLRMIDGAYVQPVRNKKTSNKSVHVVADDSASAKELGDAILDCIRKVSYL